MSRDKVTLNSEEIKPVALAIIELRLSEDITQSVSRKFCQIFKISYQLGGRVNGCSEDAWLCLTNPA